MSTKVDCKVFPFVYSNTFCIVNIGCQCNGAAFLNGCNRFCKGSVFVTIGYEWMGFGLTVANSAIGGNGYFTSTGYFASYGRVIFDCNICSTNGCDVAVNGGTGDGYLSGFAQIEVAGHGCIADVNFAAISSRSSNHHNTLTFSCGKVAAGDGQFSLVATIVYVTVRKNVSFRFKGTTRYGSFIPVHNGCLCCIAEITAGDFQYSPVVVFNGVQTAAEVTAGDGQVSFLFRCVLTTIIPAVCNQARVVSVGSYAYSAIDGHSTQVLEIIEGVFLAILFASCVASST